MGVFSTLGRKKPRGLAEQGVKELILVRTGLHPLRQRPLRRVPPKGLYAASTKLPLYQKFAVFSTYPELIDDGDL